MKRMELDVAQYQISELAVNKEQVEIYRPNWPNLKGPMSEVANAAKHVHSQTALQLANIQEVVVAQQKISLLDRN